MTKELKNTEEYYNELLKETKEKATKIYENLSTDKEISLDDDKEFIKKSLDRVNNLLNNADFHEEDFLLELQSYLKRIESMLNHLDSTTDQKKKGSILHRYKYTILKTLLDLEYEIGTI